MTIIPVDEHTENWKEGWSVFYTSEGKNNSSTHNIYELQTVDELERFKDDNEAIQFVVQQALNSPNKNNRYYRALQFIRINSPNEWGITIQSAVSKEDWVKLKDLLN